NPFASFSSEVTYQVQERLFDYLDAPVIRVTAKDVPAPYAKNLIEYYMPRVEEIVAAAKKVMYAK
ncbi:MAG: transketolase C-terminal domain-containing protein, partial [Rhodothermales bacterium]